MFPKLNRLHHFAWKCRDTEETIDFYEGILGLPLVHTIESDFVPSTGEFAPYKHIFFELQDKSCIAFFDIGDGSGVKTNTDEWIIHFAMQVNDETELLQAKNHLIANGIGVIGPTDHGFIKSIYFFDPNGLRLEITYNTNTENNNDGNESV